MGVCAIMLLFSGRGDSTLRPVGSRAHPAWRILAWFAVGAVIPAVLLAWLWTPHLWEAVLQFRWASRYQLNRYEAGRFVQLMQLLGWSKFWFMSLVASVVFVLVPLAGRAVLSGWRPGLAEAAHTPWITAVAFSVAGLASLTRSLMLPYYLVYFTVWPVAGLSLLAEGLPSRALRRVAVAAGIAVAVCWLPSLLWNVMRAREIV
jgi:hypothetical protein